MEANTDVINNQRQKTLKVAGDCLITRHFAYTVYITHVNKLRTNVHVHGEPVVLKNPSKCMI